MTVKTYTVKFYIYDVRHKHKGPSLLPQPPLSPLGRRLKLPGSLQEATLKEANLKEDSIFRRIP